VAAAKEYLAHAVASISLTFEIFQIGNVPLLEGMEFREVSVAGARILVNAI
jgi:hypothetical protein